ncbi:MAG: hypothetical protein RL637_1687 [Pseudomonadota bacterium]
MQHTLDKNNKINWLVNLACVTLLSLSGCATTSSTLKTSAIDPYEEVNRSIYDFNNSVDEYVAAPVADAYLWATPVVVQQGIGNFFNNLKDINVFFNDFLQAKFDQGLEDTGRFLVNTTVGLGGLFDIATDIGLVKHDEDFDQTMAIWGVPQGPYLVIPLLGPSTGRGVPGTVLDTALNPSSYVGVPVRALELVHLRANAKASLNTIKESALDPYVFTRDAFLQRRNYLINDGKQTAEENWEEDSDTHHPTNSATSSPDKPIKNK